LIIKFNLVTVPLSQTGIKMKKLSSKGQKWLKCLHIYSGCVWAGCATVLTIKPFFVNTEDGGELYGILSTLDFKE
jgi:hypothetical protein